VPSIRYAAKCELTTANGITSPSSATASMPPMAAMPMASSGCLLTVFFKIPWSGREAISATPMMPVPAVLALMPYALMTPIWSLPLANTILDLSSRAGSMTSGSPLGYATSEISFFGMSPTIRMAPLLGYTASLKATGISSTTQADMTAEPAMARSTMQTGCIALSGAQIPLSPVCTRPQ